MTTSVRMRGLVLCCVLLASLLASCAPLIQNPARQVRGLNRSASLLVESVPLAAFTGSTPDSAYVQFPDCGTTLVLAAEVRRVGTEKARLVCQDSPAAAIGVVGIGLVFLGSDGSRLIT
ncbi:hypothetical protein ACFFLM_24195 [Deinococcus oregonensis]|uniref:Lipoprotein n=1 Tax=Deinococcus oregonensis TaxID=1805970 RepID=A0ABV6B5L5_9DEIO